MFRIASQHSLVIFSLWPRFVPYLRHCYISSCHVKIEHHLNKVSMIHLPVINLQLILFAALLLTDQSAFMLQTHNSYQMAQLILNKSIWCNCSHILNSSDYKPIKEIQQKMQGWFGLAMEVHFIYSSINMMIISGICNKTKWSTILTFCSSVYISACLPVNWCMLLYFNHHPYMCTCIFLY